jgi:hypothetical protein
MLENHNRKSRIKLRTELRRLLVKKMRFIKAKKNLTLYKLHYKTV